MKFYILGLVATVAISSVKGQCQVPGNAKCYSISDPIGPVGSGCCSGAKCQPWLEPGEIFTVPVDWYCMYIQPLGLNEACDNKKGKCARGLNCIAGFCLNQAIPATTPAVTTPAIATPAIATPAIATPAITTPGACDAMAGELCLYTQYNINKTCCSPFVCTSVSAKSSVCKGENLSAGDSCFKTGAGSLGSCAEPLICLDGVCKEPSTECIDPVNGVCYIGDINHSLGTCCSGSECLAVAGSTDKFCQQKNIPLGGDCNQTEHRGVCDVGLKCAAGACVDKLPAGETCFESGVGSVGSCAPPLICLNDVCTEPSTTCTDPVNGKCTSFADCCPGSYCLKVADTTVTDTYCQQFIQTGGNCNQTEHRGPCVPSNFCIDGICVDGLSTVPTTLADDCLVEDAKCADATTGEKIGDCCPADDAVNPTGGCTKIDFADIAAGIKCAAVPTS